MPPNSSWRVALDELRAAGEVGVEALDAPVVERQHVVLRRLDQEQPLQLAQLLGLLRREVVRLRPVVVVSYSSQTSSSNARQSAPSAHGVLCRVTAVQPLW